MGVEDSSCFVGSCVDVGELGECPEVDNVVYTS